MGVAIDIIEPCGFPFGDAALKRAGLDYLPRASIARHASWSAFCGNPKGRLIVATTKASVPFTRFAFDGNDTLLFGRESAGVPDEVLSAADACVAVPMAEGMRSLNVAVAAGMILSEALRQTGGFPPIKETAQ